MAAIQYPRLSDALAAANEVEVQLATIHRLTGVHSDFGEAYARAGLPCWYQYSLDTPHSAKQYSGGVFSLAFVPTDSDSWIIAQYTLIKDAPYDAR